MIRFHSPPPGTPGDAVKMSSNLNVHPGPKQNLFKQNPLNSSSNYQNDFLNLELMDTWLPNTRISQEVTYVETCMKKTAQIQTTELDTLYNQREVLKTAMQSVNFD